MASRRRNFAPLKRLLLTSLLSLSLGLSAAAEPVVPWAQPQSYPDQTGSEKPLWDRVMEEEARQKERGITSPVDAASLKQGKSAPPTASLKSQGEAFVPLERRAKGARVKALQQALLSLGFALPSGADEDYGGQTEAAVKAFQSSVDLPVTGKLDSVTYGKLRAIAPPPGKMIWEDPVSAKSLPAPADVSGKKVRALLDLSEHRVSVYDASGRLQRVFPVATGTAKSPTHPGIKVVCEKLADPTALAEKLWPESKGAAFGKRLIDLDWYDPASGAQSVSDEELHGTYELSSIGDDASHGCMRLTNDNIEWMYKNLQLGDVFVVRE